MKTKIFQEIFSLKWQKIRCHWDTKYFFKFILTLLCYIVYLRYRINIMATTKSSEFNIKEQKVAELCKALAHPARIAIINFLIKKNECICSDIVNELPLSQSTVSQHLKELKNAGLIKGDIVGPRVCYCIDLKKWNEAKKIINLFLSQEATQVDKPC